MKDHDPAARCKRPAQLRNERSKVVWPKIVKDFGYHDQVEWSLRHLPWKDCLPKRHVVARNCATRGFFERGRQSRSPGAAGNAARASKSSPRSRMRVPARARSAECRRLEAAPLASGPRMMTRRSSRDRCSPETWPQTLQHRLLRVALPPVDLLRPGQPRDRSGTEHEAGRIITDQVAELGAMRKKRSAFQFARDRQPD